MFESATVRGCTAALLLTAITTMSVGCSGSDDAPPRAGVYGTVNLDGRLLEKGVIRFVPIDGTKGPKATVAVESGRFEAPEGQGPVIGQHRVEIESLNDGGYGMNDEEGLQRLQANPKRLKAVYVPADYNSHSILRAYITQGGPNEWTFNLVSK